MFVDHAAVLGLRKQVGGPARKSKHHTLLVCILPISSADRHPASLLCFLGLPYSREGPGLLGGHRSASGEVIPRASGAGPERQVKSLVPPHLRRTGRGPGAAMTMIPLDGAAQPLPLIRAPFWQCRLSFGSTTTRGAPVAAGSWRECSDRLGRDRANARATGCGCGPESNGSRRCPRCGATARGQRRTTEQHR